MTSVNETARVFFALDPPGSVRGRLVAARSQLGWHARQVPERNLHMTLVFLGDIERRELPGVRKLASQQSMPSVTLLLDEAGWFSRSRVGWLGCSRFVDSLAAFRAGLFAALDAVGLHRDRPGWSPHVTLYRNLRTQPGNMAFDPVEWRPKGFVLMESRREHCGLVYAPMGRWQAG